MEDESFYNLLNLKYKNFVKVLDKVMQDKKSSTKVIKLQYTRINQQNLGIRLIRSLPKIQRKMRI